MQRAQGDVQEGLPLRRSAPPLLLASTSRYRKQLLERLDVPFACEAPRFDESTLDHEFETTDDAAFALRLAECKARSLAASHADHLIVAADQIATVELRQRRLLHKPGSAEKAIEQLMELRGRAHDLTTGVVVLHPATGRMVTAVDRHTLTMRTFSREECTAYVRTYAPLDCVGGYRIEDAGIRLFESVVGADFTGIIGLPLLAVCRLLRPFGVLPANVG